MSRIGPSLPPHLLKLREVDSDSESSDDGYGPQLPAAPCRGPSVPSAGPSAPSAATRDSSSDSEDSYGPALPPQFKQKSDVNVEEGGVTVNTQKVESDNDSDGDVIGPTMAEKTGQLSKEDVAREFEMRSRKMKDKLEGKDVKEVQRESWMLELPEEKANSFGLGPRQFSRKGLPEKGKDRSMWTDSPAERERKLREGVGEEEVVAPVVNFRDIEMEKVSKELKQKRGSDSLMDMHEKKLQKKKKEDIANGEVAERRPFDRDIDLQANRFDDAVKKNMLKSAAKINDRFSQGNQKYL